jgi:hypothetical protein
MQINVGGKTRQCVSFTWDMGEAKAHTNARDMWGYLLQAQVMGKLKTWYKEGKIPSESIPPLRTTENMRFRDWDEILKHLEERSLYPIFLVDEFSYYRELVDSKRIDAAFLAAIRKFAINGMASFFFAGTNDLRRLIEDPSYGITGQFVNALEIQVSQIEREPAVELIRVMEPELSFTDEAIEDVLELSYQVPYFIQILCKNSALYAASTGRTIIGQPELEEVVQILTGEASGVRQSGLEVMAAGTFMNNMHSPTDPIEYHALLSTIADLNRGNTNARLVTYSEIQEVWSRSGVKLFQARLAKALQELCNREVLLNKDDEGMPAYRISVDLFRRWWATKHKYLNLELDALKHEAML